MSLTAAVLAVSLVAQCGSRPDAPGAPPSSFVYYGRDHERLPGDTAMLANPGVAGAQLTYTWRELEPERGRYDFSGIHEQLDFLERHGKRLFLQISDVTFTDRPPVPDYLLTDTAFHGGAARKLEGSKGVFDGWVARRWDPAVRARFQRLLEALAEEFDGRIEGINLPETAIGFEDPKFHPPGFTFDGYAAGVRATLRGARAAFRRSCVIVYANFMPGERLPEVDRGYLRGIYELAARIGAGVGGPDLIPFQAGQQRNSLPLIAERPPGVVAGLAVQDRNLSKVDPSTGRPVSVETLYRYAVDRLRLDYIFWGREEPYYSRDVLPYLRGLSAPQGLARSALSDSSFTWIARSAPGFDVHFLAGSYAAAHQDSLIARVEAAKAHDLALLGEERFDPTLFVFFLQDRAQMEHLLHRRATGFAEMESGSVFLVTNPDWRAFERHEVMHVLAQRLWGPPAEPSAWIQEGLAQFADGACGGYRIDPVVVGLAGGRGYVPMDTLVARFRQLNDLTAYLQAASFVGYLYRTYGRGVVEDAWKRGLGPAAEALGRTPEQLREEWERALPSPGDRPTPAEIEAIRSKGCG